MKRLQPIRPAERRRRRKPQRPQPRARRDLRRTKKTGHEGLTARPSPGVPAAVDGDPIAEDGRAAGGRETSGGGLARRSRSATVGPRLRAEVPGERIVQIPAGAVKVITGKTAGRGPAMKLVLAAEGAALPRAAAAESWPLR